VLCFDLRVHSVASPEISPHYLVVFFLGVWLTTAADLRAKEYQVTEVKEVVLFGLVAIVDVISGKFNGSWGTGESYRVSKFHAITATQRSSSVRF
jgi:hypothetical protein